MVYCHREQRVKERSDDLTRILGRIERGDSEALEQLVPLVFRKLHRLAEEKLRHEPGGHTLQTTALVNEAYLRLFGGADPSFENRAHFFAAAAEAMRRVLVEHARRKGTQKRGGALIRVALSGEIALTEQRCAQLLEVDDALKQLEAKDVRRAQVVKLRFFAGLDFPEVALALGLSRSTVKREWNLARVWLGRRLN